MRQLLAPQGCGYFRVFPNTVQKSVDKQMEDMSLQTRNSENAETSNMTERRHPATRVTIASVTSRMGIPVPTPLRSPSDWVGASDSKSGSKQNTGSAKAGGQSKNGTPFFNPTPLNPREVQSRIGIAVPSSLAPPKPPAIGPTGPIQLPRVSSASNVSGVGPSPSPPVPAAWVSQVCQKEFLYHRSVSPPAQTNQPTTRRPSGTNHESSLLQDSETYLSVLAVLSQQLHKPHRIHPTRSYGPSQPIDPQRCMRTSPTSPEVSLIIPQRGSRRRPGRLANLKDGDSNSDMDDDTFMAHSSSVE